MATTTSPIFATQLILLSLLLSSFALILVQGKHDHDFAKALDRYSLGLKKEKLTHFKLYWHDILSGKNPTSIGIVKPPGNSTFFGAVSMIDNPLTAKPELSSKLLGKAQGFYGGVSQEGIDFLMAMNFHFTQGKYNGSTITIMGRNHVFDEVREMPVIGGSGFFRFARGYVEARTNMFNLTTGDATVEYTCYVLHY